MCTRSDGALMLLWAANEKRGQIGLLRTFSFSLAARALRRAITRQSSPQDIRWWATPGTRERRQLTQCPYPILRVFLRPGTSPSQGHHCSLQVRITVTVVFECPFRTLDTWPVESKPTFAVARVTARVRGGRPFVCLVSLAIWLRLQSLFIPSHLCPSHWSSSPCPAANLN